MMICQVVGHVWATKKEEGLNGHKLMIVREVTTNRRNEPPLWQPIRSGPESGSRYWW